MVFFFVWNTSDRTVLYVSESYVILDFRVFSIVVTITHFPIHAINKPLNSIVSMLLSRQTTAIFHLVYIKDKIEALTI